MADSAQVSYRLEDPRAGIAARHGFGEMLTTALSCVICGGRTCIDVEPFGPSKETFLLRIKKVGCGIPRHEVFLSLLRQRNPDRLRRQARFEIHHQEGWHASPGIRTGCCMRPSCRDALGGLRSGGTRLAPILKWDAYWSVDARAANFGMPFRNACFLPRGCR